MFRFRRTSYPIRLCTPAAFRKEDRNRRILASQREKNAHSRGAARGFSEGVLWERDRLTDLLVSGQTDVLLSPKPYNPIVRVAQKGRAPSSPFAERDPLSVNATVQDCCFEVQPFCFRMPDGRIARWWGWKRING